MDHGAHDQRHTQQSGVGSASRRTTVNATTSLPIPGSGAAPGMPDATKGTPLGSGTVTRILGHGGMATVYEIWNQPLEVFRAVKLINPNCDALAMERFQTEAKISAKLQHPNIIEIHGIGTFNGLPYIEMEKVEGTSLQDIVERRGALAVPVVTAIGIMIARALDYAHNLQLQIYGERYDGVIHRDLKPANIMACTNGKVKLMDFGIARPTNASFHTVDGAVVGTLAYLSPEQLNVEPLDCRTDIYSLGVTLYEALTGAKAFPEENISRLLVDKAKNRYKPVAEYRTQAPAGLLRMITSCMQHDVAKRMPSAVKLLEHLERIHASVSGIPPEQVMLQLVGAPAGQKVVLTERFRFPVRAATALTLAAAAAAAGYYFAPACMPTVRQVLRREARTDTVTVVVTKTVAAQTPGPTQEAPPPTLVREGAGTAVAKPPKAAPTAPAPESKQKSFEQQMLVKHGTSNLTEIMVAEYSEGGYANALKAFESMPPDQASSPKALVYKLRTLKAMGSPAQVRAFLQSVSVEDAELYLARADLAYQARDFGDLRANANRSLRSSAAYMSGAMVQRDAYYYLALCASAEFDASPGEESYKAALDAWYQVKRELRTSPEHKYNAVATAEIQRIGKKFRDKGQG